MKLLDSEIESFLKDNGFCKFDLQCKAILPELEQLYHTYFIEEENDKFFVTHNTGEGEKAYRVHQEIAQICEPYISKYWEDYEIFAAHFVVKKGNSETSFQLHQDWNNLEEKDARSVQIWIPLKVSYPENGGMGFLPESHLFFDNYRSGSFDIPRVEVEPKLYPFLSYLRLFPGEAAFFYTSTFHCSFINSTDEDRVAVLLNIVPKEAQNIYCHKNGNVVEKYAVTSKELYDRLHLLEKGIAPQGLNKIDESEYAQALNTEINADLLIKKLKERREKKNLPADYEVKQYRILRDENLEKEINHRGYKVIDFLTSKETEEILNLFPKYFPNRDKYQGRYNSMDALSSDQTLMVHKEVQAIIKDRINHFFQEAYSPVSIIYSKKPDGVLDIDWHSDPSFIFNESLEPIYGIWCSLYDIGSREGTLMIVPGSHRFINRLHGMKKAWESPLENYWRELDTYGVQPKLKAGQAVLYDTRIIHSSTANESNINRDCTVMRVVSKKTQDFFNIKMISKEPPQGEIYQHDESYFFGDAVKTHDKEFEKSSEGRIDFFEYPITQQEIHDYFKRFV